MSFSDRFFTFKVWQMRAQSHTGWILSALSLAVALATYFKISNISGKYALVIFFSVIIFNCVIGYLDVTKGGFRKEISIYNKNNPEMQELLKRK